MDKIVRVDLSVEEVNAILTILGERPYSQVFALIGKIHQQVSPQVNRPHQAPNVEAVANTRINET